MTTTPQFLLLTVVLVTALNGCVVSKQKEPTTIVPQESNINNNLVHLAPVILLQPERYLLNGVNKPYILSPRGIIGLLAEDVQEMFGIPDFKHYDPPAQIWQYQKKECLLDIFLYVDKQQSNSLKVKHTEVRGRSISKISQKNCFLNALRVKPQ